MTHPQVDAAAALFQHRIEELEAKIGIKERGLGSLDLAEQQLKLARIELAKDRKNLLESQSRREQERYIKHFENFSTTAALYTKNLKDNEQKAKRMWPTLVGSFEKSMHLLGYPLLHPDLKKYIEQYVIETDGLQQRLSLELETGSHIDLLLKSKERLEAMIRSMTVLVGQLASAVTTPPCLGNYVSEETTNLIAQCQGIISYLDNFVLRKENSSTTATRLDREASEIFALEIQMTKTREILTSEIAPLRVEIEELRSKEQLVRILSAGGQTKERLENFAQQPSKSEETEGEICNTDDAAVKKKSTAPLLSDTSRTLTALDLTLGPRAPAPLLSDTRRTLTALDLALGPRAAAPLVTLGLAPKKQPSFQ